MSLSDPKLFTWLPHKVDEVSGWLLEVLICKIVFTNFIIPLKKAKDNKAVNNCKRNDAITGSLVDNLDVFTACSRHVAGM